MRIRTFKQRLNSLLILANKGADDIDDPKQEQFEAIARGLAYTLEQLTNVTPATKPLKQRKTWINLLNHLQKHCGAKASFTGHYTDVKVAVFDHNMDRHLGFLEIRRYDDGPIYKLGDPETAPNRMTVSEAYEYFSISDDEDDD